MTVPAEPAAPGGGLGLGLVGCGGFGRFCLEAYRHVPGLRLVAVHDTDPARLTATAADFELTAYDDYAALLRDPQVQIVAINTPPALHAAQAIAAAQAGKHVFCEKPLATCVADATAVLAAVRAAGVQLSVDYVMRWNSLYWLLHRLQAQATPSGRLLGPLQRYALENLAGDENLGPDHWFWDATISGGIFVEHGVHFFDACSWLMGSAPQAVQGLAVARPGHPALVDTVLATAVHPQGATASYYHAFSHANRAEFQGVTLDWGFAHGVLTGWIPVELALDVWTDTAGAALLQTLPGAAADWLAVPGVLPSGQERIAVEVLEQYPAAAPWHGRGVARAVSHRMRLHADLGGEPAKPAVYTASVQAGMADLVSAITDQRPPRVRGADAWRSVANAVAAQTAAQAGHLVAPDPFPAALAPVGDPAAAEPFLLTRRGIVLQPDPACHAERGGVLNPAAVLHDGVTYLFYRAVDTEPANYSRILIATCALGADGAIHTTRLPQAALEPDAPYERWADGQGGGVEDPRVTLIEGTYYMAYTAYGTVAGVTAPRIALARSTDLFHWERLGLVTFAPLPESAGPAALVNLADVPNKDAILFPERIGGRYALLHRPMFPPETGLPQSIWLSWSHDLHHWTDHQVVLPPTQPWECLKVGGGTPPIRTTYGWLTFYHGVEGQSDRDPQRRYHAGVLLLDLANPARVRYQGQQPVLSPQTVEEQMGVVSNVVFPCGAVLHPDGQLDVYYGMADQAIGLATTQLPAPSAWPI
jgi:predicted GH43/DUF377 family glycosyl hydrolase/predicted dehydrogenase